MPDRSPYTLTLPSRAHRGGARLHCVLRDAPSLTHAAGVSARPADEPADRGDVDRELRRHGALRLSDPGEHDTHPDDDLVLGSRGVRVHLCRGIRIPLRDRLADRAAIAAAGARKNRALSNWPTRSTSAKHRIRHGIRHTAARAGRGLCPCVANGRLRHILIGDARVSKAVARIPR